MAPGLNDLDVGTVQAWIDAQWPHRLVLKRQRVVPETVFALGRAFVPHGARREIESRLTVELFEALLERRLLPLVTPDVTWTVLNTTRPGAVPELFSWGEDFQPPRWQHQVTATMTMLCVPVGDP